MWRFGSLVVALAVAPGGVAAESATLSGLELQEDAASGLAHVVLTFASTVPELEVRNEPQGVHVWLHDTASTPSSHEGMEIIREPKGTWIRVLRPGATMDSIHVKRSTVTIRLSQVHPTRGRDDAYRLGFGDVVTVSVYREQDLSGDFTVSTDGTISMPLIGVVPAAGLSESALEQRLGELLGEYLVDPRPSVAIKTYQSQFVVVTQMGGRAHRVPLQPGMSLHAVLSEAGIAVAGSQDVVLTRASGAAEPLTLTAADLDLPEAPLPRDGDVLMVHEPEYIFVSGEVRRPGKFLYNPGLTLHQALTLAEGLTEWASKKEIRIHRQVNEQTVDEVVNLKQVENRKIPDPDLRPGDLIVVRRRLL